MVCKFDKSPLQQTLQRTDNIEHMYNMTKSALNNKPESEFWQEALNLIETRYLKDLKK